MRKRFNVTGPCFSDEHYMADISQKVAEVMELVESGAYFIINRPRQYGKTTMLFHLADALQQHGYIVINGSFEILSDETFQDEARFCRVFLQLIENRIYANEDLTAVKKAIVGNVEEVSNLYDLSNRITAITQTHPKKIILLIDEVDQASNNRLFLKFLGILRDRYLQRRFSSTFQSVILTGVHDVKTLKTKIRGDENAQMNSPWNIATDFSVQMSLTSEEIIPMLEEYAAAENVTMDYATIAQRIVYFTSGYPFFVSSICKRLAEAKSKKENWTTQDVDVVVKEITLSKNVNFDTLIKNLINYPRLYRLTEDVLLNRADYHFNPYNSTIELGIIHGIFKKKSPLQIHNKIYEEVITDFIISTFETNQSKNPFLPTRKFLLPNNQLDVSKILRKFQTFMREEYSKKDSEFLERSGRLVFLAYLKPIINGHGFAYKEAQISEEKRLDIVLAFYQHQYIIELKRWYGQQAHQEGLEQLADYLDRQNLDKGYLLIFEYNKEKTYREEVIQINGKEIFAIWV